MKNKEIKIIKSKSLNNNEMNANLNEHRKPDSASIQGNFKTTQPSDDKIKHLTNLNSTLEAEKQQLQKKIKEKDSRISELLDHIEEFNKKNEFDVKSDRSAKDLLKKEKLNL